MIKKVLDIVGMVFGILGAICVGQKLAVGFLIFILGSLSHGLLGYLNANYGLACTCAVFILIDIYYFFSWIS